MDIERNESEVKSEANVNARWKFILILTCKIIALVGCLYFFIVSLEIMSAGFRLLGGRLISGTNQLNQILDNKLAGLMIGILMTILVQSSSTSSSIIVSMVSSQSANIGTSVTSTFVSFSQMNDSKNFERAFSGAIVHDIFNFLSVMVLLPIEYTFGYLEFITELLVHPLLKYQNEDNKIQFLQVITKPLSNLIIQIDDSVLDDLASGLKTNKTLIRKYCPTQSEPTKRCTFLFNSNNLAEWLTGILIILLSLLVVCVSLIGLVKILNSIFLQKFSHLIRKYINTDFPGVFSHFTGYLYLLIGALVTVLIQSSSAFTSTLVPLVGLGIVTIERVFPLVLGSNIGTTFTGILAALSGPQKTLSYSLQIALCHTLFNISGIAIWYPIPFVRRIPIRIAKWIASITFVYKWFAIFYIVFVFFLVPIVLLSLSLTGTRIFLSIFLPFSIVLTLIVLINLLQSKCPLCLPEVLRTWDFLPLFMHSLQPYDRLIKQMRFGQTNLDKHCERNFFLVKNCSQSSYLLNQNNHECYFFLLNRSNLYKPEQFNSNVLLNLKYSSKL